MIKIFLDSDIILDALLRRDPFYLSAANIMALMYHKQIRVVTSSVVFVNVHYFLNKSIPANKMLLLKELRNSIAIINVGENIIDQALNSEFSDFEDAVQYFAAKSIKADFIITRNTKDYKHSTIPVLTAEQFLRTL